jgi:hypothetical protein
LFFTVINQRKKAHLFPGALLREGQIRREAEAQSLKVSTGDSWAADQSCGASCLEKYPEGEEEQGVNRKFRGF